MPKILKTRFVIAVRDLQGSAAFYRDVLGFSIHSIPDPGFLFYTSGECTIWAGLCLDALPPEIDDINLFYESVCAKGAKICKTDRDEPWACRSSGWLRATAIASCSPRPFAELSHSHVLITDFAC
jgi:hypothetical protein